MIRCHRFSTAWLKVKRRHTQARFERHWLRHLDLVLDRAWSPTIPVWSWVIEHREGLFVVDAGASPRAWDADHFDPINRLVFRHLFRFERVDPLANQMRQAGLDPNNVKCIIQTHLHFDHADGLVDFPQARVLVAADELDFHRRTPQGSALTAWGTDRLVPVECQDDPWQTFARSHRVTKAGDIRILPTPGHTPGHQSVLVEDGTQSLFLAGDLTFDQEQALNGPLPGIASCLEQNRQSLKRVRPLLQSGRITYLASHDQRPPDAHQGDRPAEGKNLTTVTA